MHCRGLSRPRFKNGFLQITVAAFMGSMSSPNLPLVGTGASIRETMSVIDQYGKGIGLVVDEQQRLLATITDGDIRRAILAGTDLNQPVMQLKAEKKQHNRSLHLWEPPTPKSWP